MFTSLYRRRAGVKHSTCTEEDVDTSIMNASTSSCGVNRGDHASKGRDVRRAKMDISHHTGDARAPFGAFETSTGALLYYFRQRTALTARARATPTYARI